MRSSSPESAASGASIGAVVEILEREFPSVSVSKIRFLESQGLLVPERNDSGTRIFADSDIARLRFILTAQRDRFLPLRIIREQLEQFDLASMTTVEHTAVDTSAPPRAQNAPPSAVSVTDAPAPTSHVDPPGTPETALEEASPPPVRRRQVRLSPIELRENTGLDLPTYTALKSFGLLQLDAAGRHRVDDVDIARAAAGLAAYGVEARHLRLFRVAADREIGLAEQILEPLRRRRARGAPGADPEKVQADIMARSLALRSALVRAGLRDPR